MAFEDLLVKIVSKLDDQGFKQLDKLETQASKQTTILSKQLKSLFVGVLGNIGVKEIVDASVKLDTLNKSFAALAGVEGGARQMKYLREESERLGQNFVTVADAYKNMFSAGLGAGMNEREIQSVFSSVLEAGTVLGSSEQEIQGALLALEQMISKGKVSMEELRRQLGNALPGAMQIAARAMKTTSKGLQEMLESGLDSQKFVTAFGKQLHLEFSEKAVAASHTLRAELQRLNNAVFDLKTSFLDGEAGEAFADTIKQLVVVLRSPELQSSMKGISVGLTFLLKNARLIGFLLGAIGLGKLIRSVSVFTVKTGIITKNLFRLSKIMKAGRFGLFAKLLLNVANPAKKVQLAIKLIEAAIWSLVIVVGILTTAWKKLTCLWDKEKKDVQPNWQPAGDGRYTDVNPKSPTFMEFGRDYSAKELLDALDASTEFIHTPSSNPVMYSAPNKGPVMYSAPQNNTVSINITTRSDDPQGIGESVKIAMRNALDSFAIQKGYKISDF